MFLGQAINAEKEKALKDTLKLQNGYLEGSTYVAGDNLTIADFSIFASLTFLSVADFDLTPFASVTRWMTKLKSEFAFHDEINTAPLEDMKSKHKSGELQKAFKAMQAAKK